MGLLDIFKTKRKNPNDFDIQWTQQMLQFAGQRVEDNQNDKEFIKKGYQTNPTVNAIVGMTQKNAGMVKWGIYKKGKDGTREPYKDVRLEELMNFPNNLMTWNQFIQEAIGFKMLTGNAYIWGIPSSNGRGVKSLYVLPSHEVQINVADNQRSILGYNLEYYGLSDADIIPYEDVLHLKTFNPDYDGDGSFLYGQSPLRAAYRSLVTNNDALDTSRNYLLNQGPRGYIYIDRDKQAFGAVSEDQVRQFQSRFKRAHQGTSKAGEILISPERLVYQEAGSTAADLKLIEHYNLTINDICNAYNFPTLLLGSGESTFSNQKEAKKALWSNVIIPALTELRDGFNNWLAPMYGEDVCIDFDLRDIKELQEDDEKKANAISKLQGIITINEARAKMGMAPLAEGGDELYIFRQGMENESSDEDNSRREGTEEDQQ